MISLVKQCSKCKIIKGKDEFYFDKNTNDGLFSWCKPCCRHHRRKYNVSNKLYMREYRKKHPNVLKEWRAKNKQRILEYDRKYRERKPEVHRDKERRRKLQKKKVSGNHTYKQWEDLLKRFDYRCFMCGKRGKLTRDHITPISKGGSDDIENILPLCSSCNSQKGSQGIEWYKDKLIKEQFE